MGCPHSGYKCLGMFTVTIYSLTEISSGKYYCGMDRKVATDLYTEVILEVIRGSSPYKETRAGETSPLISSLHFLCIPCYDNNSIQGPKARYDKHQPHSRLDTGYFLQRQVSQM
uniref:Uncharacterized protein n=1 Tax=Scleropages formosus TaxID=113540 RepID=A0A8C9SJW1_SCLFO